MLSVCPVTATSGCVSRTARRRRVDRTRQGEHLAAAFGGQPRGDQAARAQRRLDHQHAARQAGDDAVAAREVVRDARRAERELGKQQAAAADRLVKRPVAGRVDDVHAGAENGDGRGVGPVVERPECAAVGRRVDAQRQAADDGEPRPRQVLRKGLGVGRALLGGAAAADDGQRRAAQQFAPADRKQRRRRVHGRQQKGRVVVVGQRQQRVRRIELEPAFGGLHCAGHARRGRRRKHRRQRLRQVARQ